MQNLIGNSGETLFLEEAEQEAEASVDVPYPLLGGRRIDQKSKKRWYGGWEMRKGGRDRIDKGSRKRREKRERDKQTI